MTTSETTGSAYGQTAGTYEAAISEVGPGTPCGEWLRRYWHPVAPSESVGTVPQNVRLLGEDLILFRDGKGRPGLLYPRCAHRGTTLYYGKCEPEGIRCCYHGWLFAVDGRCLDQPCEPDGGVHRDRIRQPWYPVREQYGFVWAYMGPPEKMPVLPRYDILEDLKSNEALYCSGTSHAAGGDERSPEIVPCNWLQNWENLMDPYHVLVLHGSFTGPQFLPELATMESATFEYADHGMKYIALRSLPDGRKLQRVTQALFPYVRIVPDQFRLLPGKATKVGFTVPVDDTHYRLFHIYRAPVGEFVQAAQLLNGKSWSDLTEEERRNVPGDWEAQVGQGPITLHSEEHLAGSDRGVGRLRQLLRKQIASVVRSNDPLGVSFTSEGPYKVLAGNYFS
jgi:phenylpropionate dioxygenase-like ring-hydroxylating dioxygenase large terminal subunit